MKKSPRAKCTIFIAGLILTLFITCHQVNQRMIEEQQQEKIHRELNQIMSNQTTAAIQLSFIQRLADYSLFHAKKTHRVVIASYGDEAFATSWRLSLMNNICYALRHRLPFVFSSRCRRSDDPRYQRLHANHEKILLIQDLLRHPHPPLSFYEGVFWIDLDAAILDVHPEESIVEPVFLTDTHQLIMGDHSDCINNGVFFIKNSTWSHDFIESWIDNSIQHPSILFTDQGSMYFTILSHLRQRGCEVPSNACRDDPSVHRCFNQILKQCNLTYSNRFELGSEGTMTLLPPNETRFRFNQWYFGEGVHPYSEWEAGDYYRPGDKIVHTKLMEQFVIEGQLPRQCRLLDDTFWVKAFQNPRNPLV